MTRFQAGQLPKFRCPSSLWLKAVPHWAQILTVKGLAYLCHRWASSTLMDAATEASCSSQGYCWGSTSSQRTCSTGPWAIDLSCHRENLAYRPACSSDSLPLASGHDMLSSSRSSCQHSSLTSSTSFQCSRCSGWLSWACASCRQVHHALDQTSK